MENPKFSTEGIHIIADFYNIENKQIINSRKKCILLCRKAIEIANATLVKIYSHKFQPLGVTVVAIIEESSLDLHTYPEHGHVSVSFHTCGEKANPIEGIIFLEKELGAKTGNIISIRRGEVSKMTISNIK